MLAEFKRKLCSFITKSLCGKKASNQSRNKNAVRIFI